MIFYNLARACNLHCCGCGSNKWADLGYTLDVVTAIALLVLGLTRTSLPIGFASSTALLGAGIIYSTAMFLDIMRRRLRGT